MRWGYAKVQKCEGAVGCYSEGKVERRLKVSVRRRALASRFSYLYVTYKILLSSPQIVCI